jgi:hypothetical protein
MYVCMYVCIYRALDLVSDDSCTEITRNYLKCLLVSRTSIRHAPLSLTINTQHLTDNRLLLQIRQFAECNSIECAVNAVTALPENEKESFASSSLGMVLILFGSVGLLILIDYSCEKRFLWLRSCRGKTREEPNRKGGGQKQPNQQLPTISEIQSPSTSEDDIVHSERIESLRNDEIEHSDRIETLRNKRRDIENWLEHKKQMTPEKQASASGLEFL